MDGSQKNGGSVLTSLLIGAAIGAVTTFLIKRENRHKVYRTYLNVKNHGEGMLNKVRDSAEQLRSDALAARDEIERTEKGRYLESN